MQIALRVPRAVGDRASTGLVLAIATVVSWVVRLAALVLAAAVWLVAFPVRMVVRAVRRSSAWRHRARVLREQFTYASPGSVLGVDLRVSPTGGAVVRVESVEVHGTHVCVWLRRVGVIAPGRDWWMFLHARGDGDTPGEAGASLYFPFFHEPALALHRWPADRSYRAEFDIRELGEGAFRMECGVYEPGANACMIASDGSRAVNLGVITLGTPCNNGGNSGGNHEGSGAGESGVRA